MRRPDPTALQAYGAVDTDGSRFLLSDYLGNLYLLLLLREDGAGGRGRFKGVYGGWHPCRCCTLPGSCCWLFPCKRIAMEAAT